MYAIEMVKEKDFPKELRSRLRDKHRPTVGLLIQFTKILYDTGKIIILYSSFCIL